MDLAFLLAYARILINEIWGHKFLVFFAGAVTALAILLVGTQWPVSYSSSMLIKADNENILPSLLERQAAVNRVEEQVRVVRDVMQSSRLLRLAVNQLQPELHDADIEEKVRNVRRRLVVSGLATGYIKISYSGNSPSEIFNTLNTVTDLFIKDNSATQRSESREAFEFVNSQVQQYKEQLINAEESLKTFRSENFDGSEKNVEQRIGQLRSSIETMKLNLDEVRSRITLLDNQLKDEGRFTAKKQKADIYRQRLTDLQARRENLLLTYQENYPDVVNISLQIEDMKQAILDAQKTTSQSASVDREQNFNALFNELRSKSADAKVEENALKRKLKASQDLIEVEKQRRKRIAEREAELAELTRDYDVNKRIYEEMLENKEKARISMSLSVAGQGVTYKVHEPPPYPTSPTGLQFLHFAIAGIVLGIVVPIGLLVGFVLVDPRIRQVKELTHVFDIPLLSNIPHSNTSFKRRFVHIDVVLLFFCVIAFCGIYVSVGVAHQAGWIDTVLANKLGGIL